MLCTSVSVLYRESMATRLVLIFTHTRTNTRLYDTYRYYCRGQVVLCSAARGRLECCYIVEHC